MDKNTKVKITGSFYGMTHLNRPIIDEEVSFGEVLGYISKFKIDEAISELEKTGRFYHAWYIKDGRSWMIIKTIKS